MPIREVCTPISSRGRGGPGSNPPIGPGARSNPSRGQRSDQASGEPPKAHVSLGEGGSKVTVVGPQEHPEE
jgi:hypothetical protein